MGVGVYPIPLGVDRCYLIQGEKVIMVDGGAPNQANRFIKAVNKLSIRLEDIKLIVLTHGHWDHTASAKQIKDITGAKLAMHQQEKDWLEKSLKPLPPGVTAWGTVFARLMALFMPLVHIPATNVDIVLENGEYPLSEYGIPGRILHTPGHSMGSVSILLETGAAFVGDLAMNSFPLRLTPGLPIFAEDMGKLKASWELLVAAGAKSIYLSHGKPFAVDVIRRALS